MNRFTAIVVAGFVVAAGAAGAQVTDEMIANDQEMTHQVVTNGMGRALQRYSPLDMVNKDNVDKLVPAYAFSLGGEKQRGQETQPLIYDGVMYLTGSYSRLYAIDAVTGEEIWQYDARLPEGILPCCDVVNRGAALYNDKIYFGTLDARIVALDAKTGDVVWRDEIADYKAGYSYTAAPMIVDGLVITGNSGGEFGIVGEVQARDVETGEMRPEDIGTEVFFFPAANHVEKKGTFITEEERREINAFHERGCVRGDRDSGPGQEGGEEVLADDRRV